MTPMRLLLPAMMLTLGAAEAQTLTIPSEVDYGASGLVQFQYACASGASCRVRCFSHGQLVSEREGVTDATVTAFRTHNRQNAPSYEVRVNVKPGAAFGNAVVQLQGDSACAFDGLTSTSTSGFLSRTRREPGTR